MRAAEFPSSDLAGNGHSLARMYAATVSDVDGVRLLKPETVDAMIVPQTVNSTPYGVPPEIAEFMPQVFALGFFISSEVQPLIGPRSFGHPGRGGSIGFADPDSRVGFGYVMNRFSLDPADPRSANLARAVRDSL
jgi:CubicO group peptidase (beta-lactamase class C family)